MKRIAYSVICVGIIALFAGCASPPVSEESPPPVPLEVIEETLQWARENFKTVDALDVQDVYPLEYRDAQENLLLAENAFQGERYEEAYLSALESLAASQRIVRQFYGETVAVSAQEAKDEIESILAEDPESPLQEFLPTLSEILDYSEEIEGSQQEIDITRVLTDFEKVTEIGQSAQKAIKYTVESDISFASGEYRLSEQGKLAIEEHCLTIIRVKEELKQRYPDRNIIITINIVGYTEQVDFREGTNLLKLLTEGIEPQEIPKTKLGQRKFLNRRLSEFRVRSIGERRLGYFQQHAPDVQVTYEGIGVGEEIPLGVSEPYPLIDPRRRICKIYTYVLIR